MNFQPPNLPLGIPAARSAAPTAIASNFLPPQSTKTAGLAQHFAQPPQTQTPQQQYYPQQAQQQPFNGTTLSHQNLLTNGASNASSRTASPAPNNNSFVANHQPQPNTAATSQFRPPATAAAPFRPLSTASVPNLAPPLMTNVHKNYAPNNQQLHVNNLTASMQNVTITNGVNGTQAPVPLLNGNYSSSGPHNGQPSTRPPALTPQPSMNSQTHNQQQQFNAAPPNNNPVHNSAGPPPSTGHTFPPTTAAGLPPPKANAPKRPAYPQAAFPAQQPQQYGQQQYQQPPPPAQHQPNPNYPTQPQQYAGAPSMPHQQQQQQHLHHQQQHAAPPPAAFNGQPMSAAAASSPLQYQNQFNNFDGSSPNATAGGPVQHGFNKLWGQQNIDLMQTRHILPTTRVKPPAIELGHELYESVNCSPDIMRCTLTKIPESNSLLQKSRLPLGILIHPYRDLNNLPVIQCAAIVRCRTCRTYINPFVTFVDSKKWRCNLCYRVNELPEEFQFDPITKSYGDVMRRPEVKSSTIEFIAPSEYMLRPPQPAIYLFLLDVSQIGGQTGYLDVMCATLSEHLESLRGDARTQVGFVAYNSALHFYSIAEGFNQPHEITVVDIDDPFLPCPDNLLVNLRDCKDLIRDLLAQLPRRFADSYDTNSALGSALQIGAKLMHSTGGRITVFQTCLPNIGPGALKPRENPNDRSAKEIQHLGPATDFYKRLALECSAQQIAVDLFVLNSQYCDLATLSGVSKFSGGCMHHFPLFNKTKELPVELFTKSLERYITRKIGFESVMRVRCTRGLSIHTFHGNFFVRSTDLLSLPNVNPDAGFGMQISYEESLGDAKSVCFQAALLYTSSQGERRIRVHTLCLPVTASLPEVMYSADQQAIIGLISKMAVDRSLHSNIGDARDAFINASVDVFSAFRVAQNLPNGTGSGQLIVPTNLALLPMYMMAMLKHKAFRTGTSTRLDDRVFAMCELKTMPLDQLIRNIYPDFYVLDEFFVRAHQRKDEDQEYEPPLLQLTAEKLDSRSVFMLDNGPNIFILVGTNVEQRVLDAVFGISNVSEIPDFCLGLPATGSAENNALHTFIDKITSDKPFCATIQIIRDTSPYRSTFTEQLVDDRSESSLSYYEFLQHLRTQVK